MAKSKYKMSDQEVFDCVVAGLFKQGGPSIEDDLCSYRGPGNRKCAVGMLIRDKDYGGWMEGSDVYGLIDRINHHIENLGERTDGLVALRNFLKEKLPLLTRLQGIHDYTGCRQGCWDKDQLIHNLKLAADDYNLVLNLPTEVKETVNA